MAAADDGGRRRKEGVAAMDWGGVCVVVLAAPMTCALARGMVGEAAPRAPKKLAPSQFDPARAHTSYPFRFHHAVKTRQMNSQRGSNGQQRKKDHVDHDRTAIEGSDRGSLLHASWLASVMF